MVAPRAAVSWQRDHRRIGARPKRRSLDAFEHFANDEPCPALDPEHGTCDLYASRPQTCRVFGPPIATGEGYGVCELCFQTATPQEVAQAAITPPSEEHSRTLDEAAVAAGATPGATIVAFVLHAEITGLALGDSRVSSRPIEELHPPGGFRAERRPYSAARSFFQPLW